MMNRIYIVFVFFYIGCLRLSYAQDTVKVLSSDLDSPVEALAKEMKTEAQSDSIVTIGNNVLPDLRNKLDLLNREYKAPVPLSANLRKLLTKDELRMSPEAIMLAANFFDRSNQFGDDVTFQDTMIVNRLFLPALFKGEYLPKNLTFYDTIVSYTTYKPEALMKVDTSAVLHDYFTAKASAEAVHRYVENNHPDYFKYSYYTLPKESVKVKVMEKKRSDDMRLEVKKEVTFEDVSAPSKFIPERRYWTSHFESALQVAQNYVSPNWHKGGNSTLNLNNREYFIYNYNRNKVKFTNELEIKNTFFTSPNDTLRSFKVSDDVFRLHSNLGYRAFSKWYYTIDMEFRTQLLSSFAENQDKKLAGFLSPFSINLGLGMKYDLNKTFKKKHKSLTFNVNVAPLSMTYKQTIDKKIELGRHFQKKPGMEDFPTKQTDIGSTVNAVLNFQMSRSVSWYSRFYYNTNYSRIIGEWENRFTFFWSRFFSTNITVNMRYDDGIVRKDDYKHYLQINELLSFGFNYKW